MENILFGVPVIVACSLGYVFAWKYFRAEKFRLALFLLVLCGLVLYVFVSMDLFLHEWDERYHALVAKNLMRHPLIPTLYDNPLLAYDYKNWAGNHIWVHKQPFPLWLMASSLSVFGVNEFALRLPSILMSSMGIYLCYSVGKYFFDRKVGFLAAFLFSINGLIIELTGGRVATDHIDITFMFLILLAIFFTIRLIESKNVVFTFLIGISIGAAILSKWLTALIVLPIWILLVLDSGRFNFKAIILHIALITSMLCVVSLPWQMYIAQAFPLEATWESSYNFRHLTEVIEERSEPLFYFLDRIRINYGELIYLPLIWFLWQTVKDFRDGKRWALAIWFVVPLLVFSVAKTKMQGYLLFTAPALFIMTAAFFYMLLEYKKNHKARWLINVVLVLLIVLPVRYGIERIKPFKKMDRNPQWVQDLKELHKEDIKNGVLFNYNNYIEAMFYTNLVVYDHVPGEEIIRDLMQKGYTIILNDELLPDDIAKIKGVLIRKLGAPEIAD